MNKATVRRLFNAIEGNDRENLSELFDADPEGLETVGLHNRLVRDKTPLMYAMQCGDFPLAHWLLDRGANAAAVMPSGPQSSVLGLCSYFAYCDDRHHDQWLALASRLLDLGADASSGLWPALCGFGRIVNRTDLVELLLSRGADLDQPLPDGEETIRDIFIVNQHAYPDQLLRVLGITN